MKHIKRFFYRSTEFIRYTIPTFIKNVWHYRHELADAKFHEYDMSLKFFRKSLILIKHELKDSNEYQLHLDAKLKQITRAIEILDNIIDDNYLDLAKTQLNLDIGGDLDFKFIPCEDNPDLFELDLGMSPEQEKNWQHCIKFSTEQQNAEWEELWSIIKGDSTAFQASNHLLGNEYNNEPESEYDIISGKDIRGWWR